MLNSLVPSSDLLPLVIVSLVIGYVDKGNQFASSEVKFATAVGSIIPLSYYIGMGIARSAHALTHKYCRGEWGMLSHPCFLETIHKIYHVNINI